ncbi:hypothetical protein K0M31_018064 [Melipona bicolor]|uniref:Uncharacterized protein n=1 Tax=Melipona bicolor TaxID=60889 RepID=A0AA40KDV9_9HYME|nr:hypothetical protein K0M31_018064 [Melipona bicolor]
MGTPSEPTILSLFRGKGRTPTEFSVIFSNRSFYIHDVSLSTKPIANKPRYRMENIPDLLVLHTVPPMHIKIKTILFTQCDMSWSQRSQVTFTIVKLIFLYTGPLIFMSVAYWQIVKVLWRSDIPGHNCKTND